LFKPSVRIEEDITVPEPRIYPGKDSPVPAPRTLPRWDGPVPTSEVNPGASTMLIEPNLEPGGEIAAAVWPLDPKVNRQKPISKYVRLGTTPDDKTETQRLTHHAKGYLIHNDELYHRITPDVLQQCIPHEEGNVLLLDVHEGVCGHHASSRSMLGKAFQQGFYWLTAASDATQIVRSCMGCQYFTR
jgi:hypothetical protein